MGGDYLSSTDPLIVKKLLPEDMDMIFQERDRDWFHWVDLVGYWPKHDTFILRERKTKTLISLPKRMAIDMIARCP